jgi:hypothetical protein
LKTTVFGVEAGSMNAEVTYDLYQEPPRWSRVLVIACVIAVALLALWIFVPPFFTRIAAPAPHQKDSKFAIVAPQPSTVRTISIDKTPTRFESDDVARPVATGSVSVIDVSPPPPGGAVSPAPSAQDAPVSSMQVKEAPAASAAIGASTSDAWPTTAPGPAAESSFDAEIPAITPPRLPRARPHLTAAGTRSIPLPLPRPFIATEDSSSTLPDVPHERPDYL